MSLLWNDVKKTVQTGKSPQVRADDLNARLKSHGINRTFGNEYQISRAQLDYLDALDKYKGSEYYNQLLAFAPTAFKQYEASGSFADYLHSRDFAAQQDTDISTALAELGSIQREEMHNSYASQVAQQKGAGLNPFLTGVDGAGQASEAMEFPSESQPITDSIASQLSVVSQISQMGGSFISSLVNMIPFFQGVKGKTLENAGKELSLLTGSDDYIVKTLAGVTPIFQKDKDGNDTVDIDTDATVDKIVSSLLSLDLSEVKSPYLRSILTDSKKRYGPRYDDKTGKNLNTVAVEKILNEMQNKAHGERFNLASLFGDGRYDDDFNKMVSKCADHFQNYTNKLWDNQVKLNDAIYRAQEANTWISELEALSLSETFNAEMEKRDGKTLFEWRAESDKAIAEANTLVKSLESEENEMWKSMLDLVDGNKWWNTVAKGLILAIRGFSKTATLHDLIPKPRAQTNISAPNYSNTTNNITNN